MKGLLCRVGWLVVLVAACADAREECEAKGGEWFPGQAGDGSGYCGLPTSDAGKPCTDGSECEGWCEAVGYDPEKGTIPEHGECSDLTADNSCAPFFIEGEIYEGCA